MITSMNYLLVFLMTQHQYKGTLPYLYVRQSYCLVSIQDIPIWVAHTEIYCDLIIILKLHSTTPALICE